MTILLDALREVKKNTFTSKNGKKVAQLYEINSWESDTSLFLIAYLLDVIDELKGE